VDLLFEKSTVDPQMQPGWQHRLLGLRPEPLQLSLLCQKPLVVRLVVLPLVGQLQLRLQLQVAQELAVPQPGWQDRQLVFLQPQALQAQHLALLPVWQDPQLVFLRCRVLQAPRLVALLPVRRDRLPAKLRLQAQLAAGLVVGLHPPLEHLQLQVPEAVGKRQLQPEALLPHPT